MRKIFVFLIMLLFLMPIALADGMIIDPYGPIMERGQGTTINYENGLQKMIISIQTDRLRSEKAVWIFPVPAGPDETVIDVVTQMPRFYGYEVKDQARRDIDRIISYTRASQIYPLFFTAFGILKPLGKGIMERTAAMGIDIETGESVTVYEHIEKEGITVELLGAKTGVDLWVYLGNKGLDVPMNIISELRYYVNKDYTFVVSWVSQKEEAGLMIEEIEEKEKQREEELGYRKAPSYLWRTLGVEVMFPTDKIYYPLLPTSIYGSEKIPIDIYVLGFATPDLYDSIKTFTTVNYYKTRYLDKPVPLTEFFGNVGNEDVKYTLIRIRDAPSKYLTEDLWIEQGAPSSVEYADSVTDLFKNKFVFSILFIALLSLIAGAIAGSILFKKPFKFALVGLANCLSIIGLIIAIIFIKTREVDKELKKKIKQAGLITITGDSRKIIFVIVFSVLFLILGVVLGALLKIPL